MYYDIILTNLRSGKIDKMVYAYRLYQQLRNNDSNLVTEEEWERLDQIMPKTESELYEEDSILSIISSIKKPEELEKLMKKVQQRKEYLKNRNNH